MYISRFPRKKRDTRKREVFVSRRNMSFLFDFLISILILIFQESVEDTLLADKRRLAREVKSLSYGCSKMM